jgi:hypothetical protein
MEKLSTSAAKQYWKLSLALIGGVFICSYLSLIRFKDERLPRSAVLNYIDIIRDAARLSLAAENTKNEFLSYMYITKALISVELVRKMVPKKQIECILDINIDELYHHVATQYDKISVPLLAKSQ